MSKIMIVDDHQDIALSIKKVVETIGSETKMATNGEDFLSQVEDFKPELVLLDVMMPGLTTKQILERLKERNLTNIKIILVTVVRFSDEELAPLKKEFNIVDYITKPFGVTDLIARVKKQLSTN